MTDQRSPQAPLKVISSMATREVLGEMLSLYRPGADRAVISEAAGGVDVARRVQAGESVDVVILASNAIDRLISENKLVAGSRVDLVKSGIAIAVRAGAPRPQLADEESVKNAVLAARTLSVSTGPSGVYLEGLFDRWGILDDIRGRMVVPRPGVPVGALIAKGDVDLGFQQLSELLNVPGVQVVGLLPPEIQSITIFSGGISVGCNDPEAAARLLAFMASPAVTEVKSRHGMEAAGSPA